jgi:hypothetical protein
MAAKGSALTAMLGAALAAALSLGAAPAAPENLPRQRSAALAADPFSALVGKRRERESAKRAQVSRYAVAADGRYFLVEGRVGPARVKFLCGDDDPRLDCTLDPLGYAEEIHLASAARGPRGDVIYKDQAGEVLLRITAHGGATVYWPGLAAGEAASKSFGDDDALTLPSATRADAERRATAATARLSALTGEPIEFNLAPQTTPADAALAEDDRVLADAVIRAAAGMIAVAGDPTGARVLGSRVSEVRFVAGASPGIALEGRRLQIVYDPSNDAAGRPSSRAVAAFLEDSL